MTAGDEDGEGETDMEDNVEDDSGPEYQPEVDDLPSNLEGS